MARFRTLILALVMVNMSCKRTSDVTGDPSYGHFTNITGRWSLIVPVQLMEFPDHQLTTCTTDAVEFMHASSVELLREGTEIDITHLIRTDTVETPYVDVEGIIASGTHKGKKVQLIDRFFKPDNILTDSLLRHNSGKTKIVDWEVEPKLLKRVPK